MRGTRTINGKQYMALKSGTRTSMKRLKNKLKKQSPKTSFAIRKSWRKTEPNTYILYTRN